VNRGGVIILHDVCYLCSVIFQSQGKMNIFLSIYKKHEIMVYLFLEETQNE